MPRCSILRGLRRAGRRPKVNTGQLSNSIPSTNSPSAGSAKSLRKNDLKEAYDRYTKAVELEPGDPEASIGLAKALMAMDQPEKALPLLQHALEMDPTSAVAHFRLSTVYRQMGRTADAKHELEQYQKYKDMKDKLAEIYHQMRVEPVKKDSDETDSRQ